MLIRCFAREKESEGKRRRIEDSRPEILAHPCLALGRKIAAKFRKPRGDEPRHLVLVPDAQRQERSLHPSLSYLAHRQSPLAAVPVQDLDQLPNALVPSAAFCRDVFKHHYSRAITRD